MTDDGVDREKFISRWTEHVGELERLKFTLSPDRYDELDELKDELKQLVRDAADEEFGEGDE